MHPTLRSKLTRSIAIRRAFLTNALLFAAGGSALLANMNSQDRYWTFSVPGQVLVGLGAGMTYICCSQALIQTGAPEMAGVLGAIWTSALQIGLVISIAICLALATGIDVSELAPEREQS